MRFPNYTSGALNILIFCYIVERQRARPESDEDSGFVSKAIHFSCKDRFVISAQQVGGNVKRESKKKTLDGDAVWFWA